MPCRGPPVLRFDMNTQPRPPRLVRRASPAGWPRCRSSVYPDATYGPLREAIADYAGFPPEQIVPTAGADEALVLCALLALGPATGRTPAVPTTRWYENATRLAGGDAHRPTRTAAVLTWICTPHNPTGEDDARARRWRERDGLVVVDQAYVEFGGTDLSRLVRERENVRGRAHVLARRSRWPARGSATSWRRPALAGQLDAIRPAGRHLVALGARWPSSRSSDPDEMRADVARDGARERDRVAAALRRPGLATSPSRARTSSSATSASRTTAMVERLLERGLVVRTFDDLPDRIRHHARPPPPTTTSCWRRWPAPRPARRGTAPDGRSGAVERRTRETARSTAGRPRRQRRRPRDHRASASSTTC